MKRIGVLTAGGDTPAINATIYGAAQRANALGIELFGIQQGYAGVLDSRVPHIHLNPLFTSIPELDPCRGGTLLGSSRTYIDRNDREKLGIAERHLKSLDLDGLICVGGDGTINGMQPIAEFMPCVLAPKTIDNDLGLNYPEEPGEWSRGARANGVDWRERRLLGRDSIRLEDIVNYCTPGYATAVYVVAACIERIRTTAESHRRIAVVEVMGRQSGYIALGAAYGQPDLILIPEVQLDLDAVERMVRDIYDLQQHAVIVVGEGVLGEDGKPLGNRRRTSDPAGNIRYDGAADSLQDLLAERLGADMFVDARAFESSSSVVFTRKVGHTQRGGRPILFDRYYAAQLGGKAVELLASGYNNEIATLHYDRTVGFSLASVSANRLRDRSGEIHPREVHPSMYDVDRMQPSALGVEYLKPIFTNAIGWDDLEYTRSCMFSPGNLTSRYQSVNADIQKLVRYL